VGILPTCDTLYEVLEDLAITVDSQLVDTPVPFCAFNGGGDVFVDIGNKSLGLHALKTYLGASSSQVRLWLHHTWALTPQLDRNGLQCVGQVRQNERRFCCEFAGSLVVPTQILTAKMVQHRTA
jgi:hypothetical protein